MNIKTAWVFCTVIDNFGDIGVSWRLARELSQRLGWCVHLWVDEVDALRKIVPTAPEILPNSWENIQLHAWREGVWADLADLTPPDVVIETFACHLPDSVQHIIQQSGAVYLNWEYLSAEDWAIRTHAMQSVQSNGVKKFFWQMGFVPKTGGVLREQNYIQQHKEFDLEKQNHWRETWGVLPKEENTRDILVFGYESDVWGLWWETLHRLDAPGRFWLAGGKVQNNFKQNNMLPENVHLLPFVPQANFDELLWGMDMLWVRGEDSFVRAQLAGKPMFWHIYPQEEQAHWVKLKAFWQQYNAIVAMPAPIYQAHQALSGELNGGRLLSVHERMQAWQTLLSHWQKWENSSKQWQQFLWQQSDAVSRLTDWLIDHA